LRIEVTSTEGKMVVMNGGQKTEEHCGARIQRDCPFALALRGSGLPKKRGPKENKKIKGSGAGAGKT